MIKADKIDIESIYRQSSYPFEKITPITLDEFNRKALSGFHKNDLVNLAKKHFSDVEVLNGLNHREVAFIINEKRFPENGYYRVK